MYTPILSRGRCGGGARCRAPPAGLLTPTVQQPHPLPDATLTRMLGMRLTTTAALSPLRSLVSWDLVDILAPATAAAASPLEDLVRRAVQDAADGEPGAAAVRPRRRRPDADEGPLRGCSFAMLRTTELFSR